MGKYIVDIHGEIEGDYDIIGEYKEPSDSISVFSSNPDSVLISANELLNKLDDKNEYEKMTVYSIRELILSCNKIFTQK